MTRALRTVLDPYLLLLVATIALATLLPAEGRAREFVDLATYAAISLLFFVYGARLAPSAIWAGLAHWRLQTLVFAATFALFPLLGVAGVAVFRASLPAEIGFGFLFLCSLPSTVQSSITLTSIAGGNVPAALCAASISNLLGIALTPLLIALLLPDSEAGVVAGAVQKLVVQILLPFVAGQLVHRWLAPVLTRYRSVTLVIDRGSILMVVYSAFSAGVLAGVWSRLSWSDLATVLAIDLVLLALVIFVMRAAAAQLGFARQDQVTILFCGSQKSMATGLPMATAMFTAQSASVIVLPLMIYHQIQLFVGAALARHLGEAQPAAGVAKEGAS